METYKEGDFILLKSQRELTINRVDGGKFRDVHEVQYWLACSYKYALKCL